MKLFDLLNGYFLYDKEYEEAPPVTDFIIWYTFLGISTFVLVWIIIKFITL